LVGVLPPRFVHSATIPANHCQAAVAVELQLRLLDEILAADRVSEFLEADSKKVMYGARFRTELILHSRMPLDPVQIPRMFA
jgi:hypothetical protein